MERTTGHGPLRHNPLRERATRLGTPMGLQSPDVAKLRDTGRNSVFQVELIHPCLVLNLLTTCARQKTLDVSRLCVLLSD
eukprot:CAMPEP_0204414396 /NCGR_PEP_ID=MMETSP0470-20130426/20728_1 /ASSEMBLY_ACC=CAM_ASM_000385 /TAXON_ID=2969 /ORGANISM="Oxyrrhis marina" /LENGTH=79 /DNA_ID=CAMNT_0051410651 /DNA_START=139 /DNA_END=378 /DNA_ORIENTATION=+